MQEIRKLFHAINNELHKATIHAGGLRHNRASTESPEIKGLSTIENSVLNAGKLLDQIKDIVYKELRIDTNDPLE